MTRFVVFLTFLVGAFTLQAQTTASGSCPPVSPPAAPTDAQKHEARRLAEQARQASITEGSLAARDLFKRAAELDPTDANTAYALARSYDATDDSLSAVAEYCRFLSLTPDANEADDVTKRVAALTADVRLQSNVALGSSSLHGVGRPNNAVFAVATVVPGLGQYYTNRPFLGGIITTLALSSAYWGFQREKVSNPPVRQPGRPRQSTTSSDRPNLAAGMTLAVGISALSALESYIHSRGPVQHAQDNSASPGRTLVVAPKRDGIGLGVWVTLP